MQYHIFSPYRVCPLGAHVDHQHGLVTGVVNDREYTYGLMKVRAVSFFMWKGIALTSDEK